MARDPDFDIYVLKIHSVLNKLDYYRLLGVSQSDGKDKIKKAFLAITKNFHPDRNRDAQQPVKQAIYDIFKRLNEAYRVLTDEQKRAMYNKQLASGEKRFSTDVRMSMVPKTPADTISSREARQFYLKAVETLKAGNIMQAELNAKMAKAREANNEAIAALFDEIAQAKRKP
jgi:DnaJ-class molecular chaperone